LGFLTKALIRCLAAKNAVRAVVVVVVHPLLQFLREEVGVVDDLAFEGGRSSDRRAGRLDQG
jgi:hypothetical protein